MEDEWHALQDKGISEMAKTIPADTQDTTRAAYKGSADGKDFLAGVANRVTIPFAYL